MAIVFSECGLLFPILPGDTLLFAVGLFTATGQLGVNLGVALIGLSAAALLGNIVGYEIGRAVGPARRAHPMERRRFFTWSAVGAVAWAVSVTVLGYLLGASFPGLENKLELVILLIVAFSLLPVLVEYPRHRRAAGQLR